MARAAEETKSKSIVHVDASAVPPYAELTKAFVSAFEDDRKFYASSTSALPRTRRSVCSYADCNGVREPWHPGGCCAADFDHSSGARPCSVGPYAAIRGGLFAGCNTFVPRRHTGIRRLEEDPSSFVSIDRRRDGQAFHIDRTLFFLFFSFAASCGAVLDVCVIPVGARHRR